MHRWSVWAGFSRFQIQGNPVFKQSFLLYIQYYRHTEYSAPHGCEAPMRTLDVSRSFARCFHGMGFAGRWCMIFRAKHPVLELFRFDTARTRWGIFVTADEVCTRWTLRSSNWLRNIRCLVSTCSRNQITELRRCRFFCIWGIFSTQIRCTWAPSITWNKLVWTPAIRKKA